MKNIYLLLTAGFTLIGFGSGCALTQDRISLQYRPQEAVAKVKGAEEVAVKVSVRDTRSSPKEKVGSKKNGWGIETAAIVSNEDVALVVSRAISDELSNRGFKLSDGQVVVDLELTKFHNDFKMGAFSGAADGEVAFSVQVKKPDGSISFARAVVGTSTESPIFLATGKNAKVSLEGALKDATSKLVQDEAFINAILAAK